MLDYNRSLKLTLSDVDDDVVIRKVEARALPNADSAGVGTTEPSGTPDRVETELAGIKDQVEQARRILADAIGKLDHSFTSLERDTSDQRSVMQSLIVRLNGGEAAAVTKQVSIHQFAKETTGVLAQFADLLSSVSAESMKTVDRIDDMAAELDETFKLLSSVNDIADDTYLLAVNASIEAAHAGNAGRSFAVIAGNVRELSKKTRRFNDLIGAQIGKAQSAVEEVRRVIGLMASRDLNVALAGKARVQSMLGEVEEFEQFVAANVNTANAAASRISQSTSQAVTALQFEDILTQLIGSIGRRAERIGAALRDEVPGNDEGESPSPISVRQAGQVAAGFRIDESEPVNQQSMEPGEVELF